jgi:tRNA-specific 2-thiouridylase
MVMVGLSGGVDSSVAALLLQREGIRLEALFMKNWEEDDDAEYCAAAVDLADAQGVATTLDIPLHAVNFAHDYWERVFEHFLSEYRAGRTPNPDVLCNREIKFRAFLDHALAHGATAIATGHYARVARRDGRWRLLRGRDRDKDQSYFLHALDQEQLAHARFPVGELEKSAVRRLAREAGLATHDRRDSTGICFIGERRFKDFLMRFLPAQPGAILSTDGHEIGRHDGLMYYTLGQRHGLGIGGRRDAGGEAWYVVDKRLDVNVLVVADERWSGGKPGALDRGLPDLATGVHREGSLPHARRRVPGRGTRRRSSSRAFRVRPTCRHPGAVGGVLCWRRVPGRRRDREFNLTIILFKYNFYIYE